MRPQLWTRTGARYLFIAAACVAVATACGSAATGGGASGPSAAKPAKVSLRITVTDRPGAKPKHWTLQCEPTGGTHPDAAAACRALLHAKEPFAGPPKGMMCPMIVVGAKTAIVKGIYFGRNIDTTFTHGGCQLERWAKVGQIFN